MKNFIAELKQLDPNDPGGWPGAIQACALFLLLIAIITAGYFLDWQGQLNTLKDVRAEEQTLKDTYLIKKTNAVNLPILRQQLQDIEQSMNALLKQLPDKSEMEALLVDINQAGLGRGLQFELFKPAADETIKEFYAELSVSIRVTGGYHDIGAFASDVARLPRIVTLNDISITQGIEGKLILDATAKTFRYLEEDEVMNIDGVAGP